MGLMTAYYAAPLATSVTILEKSRVGDPATVVLADPVGEERLPRSGVRSAGLRVPAAVAGSAGGLR
jgi:hypothetical protein